MQRANNAAVDVQYRVPMQPSEDGNTVELNSEQARFSQNSMDYQDSLTFLNLQISGIKRPLKEISMSFTDIYQISGSAMTAQTLRLNTVASNGECQCARQQRGAGMRKARSPVFAAVYHHSLLAGTHRHAIDGASVQVQDVLQTGGAVKRYEPHSPLADANGDVWYPDVNVVEQMADMMSASRDFETNVRCAQQREKYAAKFAETGRSLMNTLALNAQSPQPTATAESNNVAASDTQSSSDSSPVDTFLTLFVAGSKTRTRPTRLTPPNISASFLRWRRWR